jgi:hypothetical protein
MLHVDFRERISSELSEYGSEWSSVGTCALYHNATTTPCRSLSFPVPSAEPNTPQMRLFVAPCPCVSTRVGKRDGLRIRRSQVRVPAERAPKSPAKHRGGKESQLHTGTL